VVIVGAGFGGLYAARALKWAPVGVTVVDRRNHHLFQPLLYQVATAGLNPSEIAAPIRRILRRQMNAQVLLAEAMEVDLGARCVRLRDGELSYDYLVVATGASHSYFGRDEWAALAPGLKTLEDALEIRRRIFTAFELAERFADGPDVRSFLTFVVIGAGPTGVELAGTIAEIARGSMSHDFRHIRPGEARVVLLEGLPRVLPVYPPELSERARQQLEALGVEVHTSARVTAIDHVGVSAGTERFPARSVFWAAGVSASKLARSFGAALDKAGRVLVCEDLTIPGHPDAFVIGDLASLRQGDGKPVPGVAPAAIQEGRFVAAEIVRRLNGEPAREFRYVDRGSLATIGRAAAVADLGRIKLSGFVAWLAWLLVHLFFLIGFRNRLLVLLDWATAYLTYDRGARLITGPLSAPGEEVPALGTAEEASEAPPREKPTQPPREHAPDTGPLHEEQAAGSRTPISQKPVARPQETEA
jgi:NADH dehydrogenase